MFGPMARQRRNVGILIASLIASGGLTVWAAPAPATANFCIVQPGYKCLTATLTLSGNGTGTFKTTTDSTYNTPDGFIDCDRAGGATTGTCAFTYLVPNGTTLTIYWQARATATGSLLFYFSGGGKQYQNGVTTVPWSSASAATIPYYPVSFSLVSPVTLTVSTAGSGKGSITSNPTGISCGLSCSDEFASGEPLTLTAKPITGSVFGGWSTGPCHGQTSVCHFTPTAAVTVVATFNPKPAATAAPKVTPAITPTPVVASSPSPAGSPSEVVAAASAPAPAPSQSNPAAPLVAGGSASDLTPTTIGAVVAALLLGAAILIWLVIGRRPRRRDRPQT